MCSIIPKKILKNIEKNDKTRKFYSIKKDIDYREKRKRISANIEKGIEPDIVRDHTEHLLIYDNKYSWDFLKNSIWEDFTETHHVPKKTKRTFTRDLDKIYDMFHDVLQRESYDNRNARLEVFLKYGRDYVNAYWDGEYLVFGTGDRKYFSDFSKSYDTIAHELGHAITQYECNLRYENQSGALNEHISDVFGICAYQKKLNQSVTESDWLIGKIWTKNVNGKALRSFKNEIAYDDPVVGKDEQPKHMDGFLNLPNTEDGDWGGVHYNSGIPNHAFYLYNLKIGGNSWENGSLEIWYNAMLKKNGLGPTTNFEQFARKTIEMATQLGYNESLLGNTWQEVGVLT